MEEVKEGMTKTEKKRLAQDLIMDRISTVGYIVLDNEEYKLVADDAEFNAILKYQMDRVAKMFGYPEAWFS